MNLVQLKIKLCYTQIELHTKIKMNNEKTQKIIPAKFDSQLVNINVVYLNLPIENQISPE